MMNGNEAEIAMKMSADAKKAADVVRRGGIILYPTDTVWGIGCDATNPVAIRRIYDLKQRADGKSLLALVDSPDSLRDWVEYIPPEALQMLKESERPLTFIYDRPKGFAPNMLAEDGSVGIRITSDPYCQEICRLIGRPLVSTSANISGFPTPHSFRQISREMISKADYTSEWRREDECNSRPSRILKLHNGGIIVVRR